MKHSDLDQQACSIAKTMSVVGERWTLLILREAFWGVRRFEQMQRSLGIARNILTARLQALVAHGILERQRYDERADRHEYRLTEKGVALWPAIVAFMQWGDEYMNDEPAVTFVHKPCGHETQPRLTCAHCGEQVTARDVTAERHALQPA